MSITYTTSTTLYSIMFKILHIMDIPCTLLVFLKCYINKRIEYWLKSLLKQIAHVLSFFYECFKHYL